MRLQQPVRHPARRRAGIKAPTYRLNATRDSLRIYLAA
jgi:hypothetical protein